MKNLKIQLNESTFIDRFEQILESPKTVLNIQKKTGLSKKLIKDALEFILDSEEYLVNGYDRSFNKYVKNWISGEDWDDSFIMQWTEDYKIPESVSDDDLDRLCDAIISELRL